MMLRALQPHPHLLSSEPRNPETTDHRNFAPKKTSYHLDLAQNFNYNIIRHDILSHICSPACGIRSVRLRDLRGRSGR